MAVDSHYLEAGTCEDTGVACVLSSVQGGQALSVDVGIDVGLLKSEIKKTYASVSQDPEKDFIFPTGRAWAEDLGYPDELSQVPDFVVESFAGVANPWVARAPQARRARARCRLRCRHGLAHCGAHGRTRRVGDGDRYDPRNAGERPEGRSRARSEQRHLRRRRGRDASRSTTRASTSSSPTASSI